jgi:hypothetical protein
MLVRAFFYWLRSIGRIKIDQLINWLIKDLFLVIVINCEMGGIVYLLLVWDDF